MADVQYVTLYLRGGTPVTVIAGSVLYGIYLAAGATLYPSQTPPGSGIPTNPADPFPQYITADELNTVLADYAPGDGGGTVDLGGTPLELRATAGTYPARPATTRPVHFIGPTAPAGDGSTAGGGGMVPGIDSWFWWAPQ